MPASRQRCLIPFHGVRRHGDDRHVGIAFRGADGHGRFEAIHFRHLYVHQDQVEGLREEGVVSFFAVVGDDHLMAAFLQQPDGQLLIDGAVFGQQDPQARRCAGRLPTAAGAVSRTGPP